MELTHEEYELIELLREWSTERDPLRFTASCENGVWECELRNVWSKEVVISRGVGNSFVRAFCGLDGNDVEPIDDDSG